MARLRWRLARLLVGPFVTLPESGAWLVVRDGVWTAAMEVERLRLKSTQNLARYDYDSTAPVDFTCSRTFTRFVGTVKR